MATSKEVALALFSELDKLKQRLQSQLSAVETANADWAAIDAATRAHLAQLKPKVKINVGGKCFSTSKGTLTRFPTSVFTCALATKEWDPADGVYFFDRNPSEFDHVLDYLSTGSVRLDILDVASLKNLKSHFEYFAVPYAIDLTTRSTTF